MSGLPILQKELDSLGDVVDGIRKRVRALEERLGGSAEEAPAAGEEQGEGAEETVDEWVCRAPAAGPGGCSLETGTARQYIF